MGLYLGLGAVVILMSIWGYIFYKRAIKGYSADLKTKSKSKK